MNTKNKKRNKIYIFFFIGIAYFVSIPLALLSREGTFTVYQGVFAVIPPLIIYLICCALLYRKRHEFKHILVKYDIKNKIHQCPHWCYRHRWFLGIGLWGLFTVLQIHGSAIGVYAKILNNSNLNTDIIGFSRPDRFDEWLNMTSFAFSQYVPGPDGSFSYFNSYLRAIPTDMFIVLGQPCWDICTLFRPFLLGYLFLPPGNGLAFFWMGRLIILGLVSYEFARLWTQDSYRLSGFYALMITLSPAVQWWFAVNAFVEMLIAGQAAVLVLRQYMQCQNRWLQAGWSLVFAYFSLMYIYVMYPAWQIPFAYIFVILSIFVIRQYGIYRKWCKWDIIPMGVIIFTIVLAVLHTLNMSNNAIALLRSSEYPGRRFITGGGLTWDWLFNSGLGLFTPFSGLTRPQYAFNMTQFFDFSPLGIILAVYNMTIRKTKDFLLCALLILDAVFIAFCMLPWPHWLAGITLFFQVPEARMIIPISFINIILILRVLALWPQQMNKIWSFFLAGGIALFSAWASFHYCEDAYWAHNVVVLLIVTFIGILCICRYRRHLGPLLLGLFLCIGGMINPIAHGVASIYDAELGHEIAAITANDKGRWIVIGENDTTINNYPTIFGAPTINSYNTYVAWDNWNKLDLDDEARRVVNRCAHFKIKAITEEPSTYHSEHGDLAEITLSRDDVKRLDVQYILSDYTDLQPLDTETIQFKPIVWANGFIIYKVIYQEE